MADKLKQVYPSFSEIEFEQQASQNIDTLELKQRSQQICNALILCLPDDFEQSVTLLIETMGKDDGSGGIEGYEGFRFMPFLDYVAVSGSQHPDLALDSLAKMTLYFSAEFAIRPFILKHPTITLPQITKWTSHLDWRVRRLASEGIRPRLPWGMRLKPFIEDPSFVINTLDRLYDDSNLVVRRSVANNLNDIAKDHPDIAIKTAKQWWNSQNELAHWTVRHGMRTLIKQGNKNALSILGFVGGNNVRVNDFYFQNPIVTIGDELNFSFELISEEDCNIRLVVDYVLHRVLAKGKISQKVFKLKQIALSPGEKIFLQSKHKFKQLSTRTYYPGQHSIEILANGYSLGKYDFELNTKH